MTVFGLRFARQAQSMTSSTPTKFRTTSRITYWLAQAVDLLREVRDLCLEIPWCCMQLAQGKAAEKPERASQFR